MVELGHFMDPHEFHDARPKPGRGRRTAQDVVREAGRQASAVAESVYGQGGDLIEVIEGAIRGNPISSVLVAAALGYGIARLSHPR
jgi:hypothetical protein